MLRHFSPHRNAISDWARRLSSPAGTWVGVAGQLEPALHPPLDFRLLEEWGSFWQSSCLRDGEFFW